jgi:hypothetical protein
MLMEEDTPAMEADDITQMVSDNASKMLGNTSTSKDGSTDTNGEISLDTDDILGTKSNPNNGVPEDEDNNNDDDMNLDDPNMDENDPNNPDENMDDPNGDNNQLPDNPPSDDPAQDNMEEKEDPFSASRKKKLWGNYKAFYDTLGDSIDLISKYVPNISDAATIKAMDNIKDNLMEAKTIIYRTLTEDYPSLSYPELEKKYIGLNNIYDICTKELKTYFTKYRQQP